jgi:hypothetical protein
MERSRAKMGSQRAGATTIKAAASRPRIVYGERTIIRGTLSRPRALVVLYRQKAGETTFTRVASTTASATGTFAFRRAPVVNTLFRLEYPGNEHWLPAVTEVALPAIKCQAIELKITGYSGKSPAIRELMIYGPEK